MRTGVRLEKGDEMNKNLKMPWSMDDTIENLKELKGILKTHIHKINYKGMAESDAEEIEFDFNRAIEALEKQIPTKVLSDALIDKCGSCMETLTHQSEYCPWCGQALNWRER